MFSVLTTTKKKKRRGGRRNLSSPILLYLPMSELGEKKKSRFICVVKTHPPKHQPENSTWIPQAGFLSSPYLSQSLIHTGDSGYQSLQKEECCTVLMPSHHIT